MEFFEVGGCVRDELLGVKSKDIDFTVVLDDKDILFGQTLGWTPFEVMRFNLEATKGFKIFVETPEFLTIRARFPRYSNGSGFVMRQAYSGMTADFVLARKESNYTDGRRPEHVEPGTLLDDLARRDFTMNAVAKDSEGNLIDPFGGVQDIKDGIIRAVGDPRERFEEDALRIVRALRFSVTKGFRIDPFTQAFIMRLRETVAGVSAERVREELTKMFNADPMLTVETLDSFQMFPIIFDMGINFQPTLKERIR